MTKLLFAGKKHVLLFFQSAPQLKDELFRHGALIEFSPRGTELLRQSLCGQGETKGNSDTDKEKGAFES